MAAGFDEALDKQIFFCGWIMNDHDGRKPLLSTENLFLGALNFWTDLKSTDLNHRFAKEKKSRIFVGWASGLEMVGKRLEDTIRETKFAVIIFSCKKSK